MTTTVLYIIHDIQWHQDYMIGNYIRCILPRGLNVDLDRDFGHGFELGLWLGFGPVIDLNWNWDVIQDVDWNFFGSRNWIRTKILDWDLGLGFQFGFGSRLDRKGTWMGTGMWSKMWSRFWTGILFGFCTWV